MSTREPLAVRWAMRAFGWCVRLLPARLRSAHGENIANDFAGLAGDAYERGGARAVAIVFLRSLVDLLIRLPHEKLLETDPEGFEDLRGARAHAGDHMRNLLQELRLAARSLRRRPGFTTVAVLTLAIGIGANIAIFAVVNAVLIRPLPYPESDRIVWVSHNMPGINMRDMRQSPGTLGLYQRFATSYASQSAIDNARANLTGAGEPVRVQLLRVTPSFFDVMGVRPVLGRAPSLDEATLDAPRVAVLTHLGWQKHFGGTREVIGRTVRLNDQPVEIIGVMPKSFAHPYPGAEIMVPIRVDDSGRFGSFSIGSLMRLRDGVTLEAAQAESVRLQSRLTELYPDMTADMLKQTGFSTTITPLRDYLVSDAETGLWIVLGTVGFLLLVACASVANLFLVRAESRQREVSVRFALGATRARVALTFLSESVLLGAAGGAWGLVLAYYGVRTLKAAGPAQLPRLQEIALDLRVVGFASAISLLAGIVFGVLPLTQQMRRPLLGIARSGRGDTASLDQQRVRKTLIVAQIALALVMVTGSGLMLRSFQKLRSVDSGVRPEGVLTVAISTDAQTPKQIAAGLYQRMIDEIDALPGTTNVGAISSLPLDPQSLDGGSFSIRGIEQREQDLSPFAFYSVASGGYFEAIGTRVLRGRGLERSDHEQARRVIVISETFAQSIPGDPLGREVLIGGDSSWMQVVGVVQDVRTFGLREDSRPMGYIPMVNPLRAAKPGLMTLVMRTSGDPLGLVTPVRAAIRRVDANVPIISARTMQRVVDESIAETSFTMTILLIAAVVALLLGAIGLYGVIGYVVSQRTSEIGLRIALGADPLQVQRLVLRQGLVLAGVGVAIGLLGAVALSRFIEAILFQVDSRDPITFGIVALVMLAVSGIAAYLPARRASSVSPLQALRME